MTPPNVCPSRCEARSPKSPSRWVEPGDWFSWHPEKVLVCKNIIFDQVQNVFCIFLLGFFFCQGLGFFILSY